ncbi:MAG: hypothetical protein GXX99_02725 [Clostridiales bacterium]|nr:hypothetical protein [Clostridiales bacterium]
MRLEYLSGLQATVLNTANLLGMAFDGTYFYLPQPDSRTVLRLNRDLETVASIPVKRRFQLLFWDHQRREFWAAGDTPFRLYRLNRDLSIRETVTVCLPYHDCVALRGIGKDCESGNLILTTSEGVYEIDRNGCFISRLLHTSNNSELLYVLVVAPYLVIYYCRNGRTFLALAERCGRILEETQLPRNVSLGAIMFDPTSNPDNPQIFVTVLRCNVGSIVEHALGVTVAPCNFISGETAGVSTDCCCLASTAAAEILCAMSCINQALADLLLKACCDNDVAGETEDDCCCNCCCICDGNGDTGGSGCGNNGCNCGNICGCTCGSGSGNNNCVCNCGTGGSGNNNCGCGTGGTGNNCTCTCVCGGNNCGCGGGRDSDPYAGTDSCLMPRPCGEVSSGGNGTDIDICGNLSRVCEPCNDSALARMAAMEQELLCKLQAVREIMSRQTDCPRQSGCDC